MTLVPLAGAPIAMLWASADPASAALTRRELKNLILLNGLELAEVSLLLYTVLVLVLPIRNAELVEMDLIHEQERTGKT